MARLWKWFLAFFRLSPSAVCEMSIGRGLYDDYHDYPDADGYPEHMIVKECRRCGKRFYI
jgi:hypothetical protein